MTKFSCCSLLHPHYWKHSCHCNSERIVKPSNSSFLIGLLYDLSEWHSSYLWVWHHSLPYHLEWIRRCLCSCWNEDAQNNVSLIRVLEPISWVICESVEQQNRGVLDWSVRNITHQGRREASKKPRNPIVVNNVRHRLRNRREFLRIELHHRMDNFDRVDSGNGDGGWYSVLNERWETDWRPFLDILGDDISKDKLRRKTDPVADYAVPKRWDALLEDPALQMRPENAIVVPGNQLHRVKRS